MTESNNLENPDSWVIVSKDTGKAVAEIYDKKSILELNMAKYEALPIREYLSSLNKRNTSND